MRFISPAKARYSPSTEAACGLDRCPASLSTAGTSGSDTKSAQPCSSQSRTTPSRLSSFGSRYTTELFEPCRARLSAPAAPNTFKNCSTSATVVVASSLIVSSVRDRCGSPWSPSGRPAHHQIPLTDPLEHRQNYSFTVGSGSARGSTRELEEPGPCRHPADDAERHLAQAQPAETRVMDAGRAPAYRSSIAEWLTVEVFDGEFPAT